MILPLPAQARRVRNSGDGTPSLVEAVPVASIKVKRCSLLVDFDRSLLVDAGVDAAVDAGPDATVSTGEDTVADGN